MTEPYWWYVLFVRANLEHRAATDVQRFFEKNSDGAHELEAFVPESEQYYRNKKAAELGKVYVKRPLFPGYVFVETNIPEKEFARSFAQMIYNSETIIRLLHYGEFGSIALPLNERQRFEYLFMGKRCVEHSKGYIEGERVCITAGPLIGREGSITRINRHNRTAVIEVEMFGKKNPVKVALEIISKS